MLSLGVIEFKHEEKQKTNKPIISGNLLVFLVWLTERWGSRGESSPMVAGGQIEEM